LWNSPLDSSFPGYADKVNMHEIRIAEDLANIVLETADMEGLCRVTGVNISFGQLVQIVPDIFEFAFREAVSNTLAKDAKVNIEIIPVIMVCSDCGCEFHVRDNLFACNNCNSTDIEIVNGKELFVRSIEGE